MLRRVVSLDGRYLKKEGIFNRSRKKADGRGKAAVATTITAAAKRNRVREGDILGCETMQGAA